MYIDTAIEAWIYTTLSSDATLMDYLAPLNLPPNYQQCVYMHLAPQVDPISNAAPQPPYVVATRYGVTNNDDVTIGDNILSYPMYRISVWDTQSGMISMRRCQDIMERVAILINRQTVTSNGHIWFIRKDTNDSIIDVSSGGRVDYGVSTTYHIIVQQ